MRALLAIVHAMVGPHASIDRARLERAVALAEARSGAEIFVAIAPFFVGRVDRAAERAFERLGVAHTRRRTGVLLFVVPSRRAVVVLADHGARVRGADTLWRDAADRIAEGFARGDGTGGLVEAIDHLSSALAPILRQDAPAIR
jgi:uncharacterized membrane protein YgcG